MRFVHLQLLLGIFEYGGIGVLHHLKLGLRLVYVVSHRVKELEIHRSGFYSAAQAARLHRHEARSVLV